MNNKKLPEVVVTATWRKSGATGPWWRMEMVDLCPSCGTKRHVHGGGNHPDAPLLMSRTAHCDTFHTPFRVDCEKKAVYVNGELDKGKGKLYQRLKCGIQHVPEYELVLSPS